MSPRLRGDPLLLVVAQLRLESALPDVVAHGSIVGRMFSLPPVQVMQIAAKLSRGALHGCDLYPISKTPAALATQASADMLGLNIPMPGDAAVAILIEP